MISEGTDNTIQCRMDEQLPFQDSAHMLAKKILDRKRVSGLTKTERSTLFHLLTGGVVVRGGNHKSELMRDLLIAIEIQSENKVTLKNDIIRQQTGKYCKYTKDSQGAGNNISNYRKRIEGLLSEYTCTEHVDLKMILVNAIESKRQLTSEQIRYLLGAIAPLQNENKMEELQKLQLFL